MQSNCARSDGRDSDKRETQVDNTSYEADKDGVSSISLSTRFVTSLLRLALSHEMFLSRLISS